MLRIHTVTSAAAVKKYFETADYYSEGQEVVGNWIGGLAERLNLAGQVTKAEFDRLCDNRHPFLDKPLTQRTNEFRRVGNDMVFSGPKSFSVVEGLADSEEKRLLLAAFDDAINETLVKDIEPDMQARVRKSGAFDNRTTGNLLAAGYDHSTARPVDDRTPPDPHRHRHVFVFNATYDPVERKIKAAEIGNIVRDRPYYQAAFYARLANKLEALGYVIDRRADGKWEIAGVPQSVIDKFSKRTDEIEAEAERLGVTHAGEKAELGAKTRSKKQKDLTPAELRTAWEAQLTDGERDALGRVYGKQVDVGKAVTAKEAVAYAIKHVSEKLSVMPERELKRVALLYGLGSVSVADVAAELPRQGVITGDIDGRLMATTPELQREEDYIASVAARGRCSVVPVGMAEGLSRSLPGGKSLNDGQWQVVGGLLESSNRVNLVEGPAGAGKSSLLSKFDEGLRAGGQSATYLATTAAAVSVLQEDRFDAHTLARFLVDEKMQAAASGGRVVIDESSMLGHKDAVRFMGLVETLDLKPIFVGDPMQHGAVPRGSFLHVLKKYGCIEPHRLTQILRQELPAYRAAAQSLSEGNTLAGFDALDRLNWVKEVGDDAERYRQIAAEYRQALDDRKSVLVVSPTHAEAAAVTAAIRSELRKAGRLAATEHAFTRLVAVDASEAERGQATTYRKGDVIQFHQNAKGHRKGERLTVGDPAEVPLHLAGKFSLYRPQTIGLSVGDVIRFTGTVKTVGGQHTLRNGSSHRVAEITAGGNIRLDNGWLVGKDAGHFRHGFVETSFGSQGRTVQRAILAMSAASLAACNQEQLYVSISRAIERLTLYTDDKAAVRQAVGRSSQKLAALDLKPQADAEAGERSQHDKQRLAYAGRTQAASQTAGGRPRRAANAEQGERQRKELEHKRRLAYAGRPHPAWGAAGIRLRRPAKAKPPTHTEKIHRQQQERNTGHER